MFCFSLYEDTSAPSLTSPEADNCDKWPGEAIFPGYNYNQEFLVPELFLLENVDCLPEKYDDVEPEDELMSILEEIITEDKKKTEGEAKLYTSTKRAKLIWAYLWAYSLSVTAFHYAIFAGLFYLGRRTQSMDF